MCLPGVLMMTTCGTAPYLLHVLSDERKQFFFLVRFAQEVVDADLESVVAVFLRRARGNHDDRNGA